MHHLAATGKVLRCAAMLVGCATKRTNTLCPFRPTRLDCTIHCPVCADDDCNAIALRIRVSPHCKMGSRIPHPRPPSCGRQKAEPLNFKAPQRKPKHTATYRILCRRSANRRTGLLHWPRHSCRCAALFLDRPTKSTLVSFGYSTEDVIMQFLCAT